MPQTNFDPSAVYLCRGCKEPLRAGTITALNFEWHQAHGTYHESCDQKKVDFMVALKKRNRGAKALGASFDATTPHDSALACDNLGRPVPVDSWGW